MRDAVATTPIYPVKTMAIGAYLRLLEIEVTMTEMPLTRYETTAAALEVEVEVEVEADAAARPKEDLPVGASRARR